MDNDKAAEVNCPHSFIPGHCGDIDALQITRTVEVEHSWPLVPEDEATITIHTEVDKPVVVVLPELRVYIPSAPFSQRTASASRTAHATRRRTRTWSGRGSVPLVSSLQLCETLQTRRRPSLSRQ